MGWSNQVVIARVVVVEGASDGVFVYAPGTTPGPGNPPAEWMSLSAADPFGNVLPQQGTGSTGAGETIAMNAGVLIFSDSAGATHVQQEGASGGLVFSSNVTFVSFTMPVADIYGVRPGTTTTQDIWRGMILLNGWTSGGRVTPQFRVISSPPNTVEVIGSLTAPAGLAGGQAVWNFPAGYTFTNGQSIVARNVSTGAYAAFSVVTGSPQTLQYQTGAVAGNIIDFHGFISRDA